MLKCRGDRSVPFFVDFIYFVVVISYFYCSCGILTYQGTNLGKVVAMNYAGPRNVRRVVLHSHGSCHGCVLLSKTARRLVLVCTFLSGGNSARSVVQAVIPFDTSVEECPVVLSSPPQAPHKDLSQDQHNLPWETGNKTSRAPPRALQHS